MCVPHPYLMSMLTRREAIGRLGGLFVFAIAPMPRVRIRDPFPHPDPRPGITGERVLAPDQLPDKKSVRQSFDAARTYPEIFDGVYCPCACHDSLHHRSLLSCFESKQPVGCMGCREAADFIEPLAKDGKRLAEIRVAVDKKFG